MYIVTGGAGFIGSNMVSALNSRGIKDILIVDNLGKSEKWKNLVGLKFIDYLHKDLFLEALIESDMDGSEIDAIIHLGACSSTTESNAEYMIKNNFQYTKMLMEWAVEENIRFIYASSAATYGRGEHGYSDDIDGLDKLRPLNLYGFTKHLADLAAQEAGLFDKVVGLKFFNVYGPNEYHKGEMRSVALKAFEQIKNTGTVNLFKSYHPSYKDGEQRRDFVYVKDCCEIICWFLDNPDKAGLFNCGSGESRTWNDLAHAVFEAIGLKPSINYIDMPENIKKHYQYDTKADITKLRSIGCQVEFTPLEEGIKDYVANYLMQD